MVCGSGGARPSEAGRWMDGRLSTIRGRSWKTPQKQSSAEDDGQRKAVVAFGADGLQHRRTEARFGGSQLSEAADALHVWVFAIRIDDHSLADDVVGDDDRTGSRKLQSPAQILG